MFIKYIVFQLAFLQLPQITADQLPGDLPRQGILKSLSSSIFQDNDRINYFAPGTNGRHATNAFLLRFKPYNTDKVWLPLVYISNRLKYQHDSIQFKGKEDLWQTSVQAYHNLRGDCEDHAILLADWLIELGYDARVAVGTLGKEGHAWVVLFKDGNEYIIEATSKNSDRIYPLAKYKSEYSAAYMFNQDYFWRNNRHSLMTSYSSNHWEKLSQFVVRMKSGTEEIEDLDDRIPVDLRDMIISKEYTE
jgi:hypothetical protein